MITMCGEGSSPRYPLCPYFGEYTPSCFSKSGGGRETQGELPSKFAKIHEIRESWRYSDDIQATAGHVTRWRSSAHTVERGDRLASCCLKARLLVLRHRVQLVS